MNPKIARDPYLRPLCERYGEDAALEAGFFEDTDPDDAPLDDVDWLCTPTAHVRRGLAATAATGAAGPPVVLLSTGGFLPVHDGHLAMMATARRTAEDAGLRVVGGYLSPGHDEYLALKCGGATLPASARLALAADALAGSDWLAVDPWEALGRRVAVNFTDVTARLQRYLRAHVDPAIEVCFVCGGDNARFALAFAEVGRCIVVGRPGHEGTVARWAGDPRIRANPAVRFAPGADPSASSSLRPVRTAPPVRRLRLRLEDGRAVAGLGLGDDAWRAFQDGLVRLLGRDLDLHPWPAAPADAGPAGPDADAGRDRSAPVGHDPGNEHGDRDRVPTISLDPFVAGDVDLGISRLFDLGGYHLLGHVARPGSPPVAVQVATVPAGRWRLHDDDRATGATAAHVRSVLPAGVTIESTTFAVDDADADAEIADSRDFLLGTDHGGLVVALPDGTVGRAPYLLPFVDPAARCGVPAHRALTFSRDVWRLAADALRPSGRVVGDLPAAAGRTLRCAGVAASAPLHEVAEAYARRLDALAAGPAVPGAQAPGSRSVE